MPTYDKISVQTLGSSASSVTFSSLTQGYTDLIVHIHGRSTGVTHFDNIRLTINGSTSDNLYQARVIGQNVSIKECDKPTGAFVCGALSGASATTGYTGFSELNILGYSSTVREKVLLYKSGTNTEESTNSTAGSMFGYGFWNIKTTAITSLVFTLGSGGSFLTGSSFSLYGLKNT